MKIFFISMFFIINLYASFKDGEDVFKNKCSTCHKGFIDVNLLKENFFEKDNKLLNLKAPTVNMLVYAIMDSPKKIGEADDEEMREIEITNFLKSYLEQPDRFNSICDDHILSYYETKKSMKNELKEDDYKNLTNYFMGYKDSLKDKSSENKALLKTNDYSKVLEKAKKEKKKIIIYATSKTCYFCKKMEAEVLSLNEIKNEISKDYIFQRVDVDEESLPFNLEKEYKKITPTFFILNSDGSFQKQFPGSWKKGDFLEILKENKK